MSSSDTTHTPAQHLAAEADSLPINQILPSLVEALDTSNRCLLVAQPGAGKTTRAPLEILRQTSNRPGRWLLLEPRRVAARLAAGYMASLLNEKVGQTVGYRVRGESKVSSATRLEVVTQGILTRIIQDDPLLDGVQGIIFDEFHERSLDADLGLALALDVQNSLREDLKLLVMSATLDVDSLLTILGQDTPVIDCPGRSWPVDIHYRPPPLREAAENHQATVVREALAAHDGDILVFLPGQREINRLNGRLESMLAGGIDICQLHGQLPLARQREVLESHNHQRRRVILSTAVAESSVTVPGVRIVIDGGLERVPLYQPRSGLTSLETRRVNRASAAQRSGRAGREAAGACYRLWSEETPLAAHREAEIQQADLSGLAYELLRWGISDPAKLAWASPVPAPAFAAAMALLKTLKLTDADGKLTDAGKRCARWPTHPRLAALLDHAAAHDLLPLACWLVAWLEESPASREIDLMSAFSHHRDNGRQGDAGRWRAAAEQWGRRLRCQPETRDFDPAATLLAVAYPDRLAENRGGGKFRLVSGGQATLPENHPLARTPYLVITDLDGQASGARIFAAIAIPQGTIESLFPETLLWQVESRWDPAGGKLVAEEVRRIGSVELARRPSNKSDPAAVKAALLSAVRQRGEFSWSDQDRQLLGRLRLLHRVLGDPWPDVSDPRLLADLDHWLAPQLDNINRLDQLDSLPLGQYVLQALDWSLQRQLDTLAPTHLQVPSGSSLKLDYSGEEPVLAVKLQEMFGQTETPRIVNGRVPITIHLLSPARRPVQVTRDLANFWANTYFEVRKDLKGRYPRHPWPDNPLLAEPTRHAKQRR